MACIILVVQSSMIKYLIGRNGNRIKNIEEDTNSIIKVLYGDSQDKRKVIIYGKTFSQLMALNKVMKIVGVIFRCDVIPNPETQPTWRLCKERAAKRKAISLKITSLDQDVFNTNRNTYITQVTSIKLPPMETNFYTEQNEIQAMSIEVVELFRSTNDIFVGYLKMSMRIVDELLMSKPIRTFEHVFHLHTNILLKLKESNFKSPTPLQCQAWPIILSGRELIITSKKKTGKKLSYILPAIIHASQQPIQRKKFSEPSVLILSPTKESALKILNDIEKYIFDEIRVVGLFDGENINSQINQLIVEKPDIIVATPNRLNELIILVAVKLDFVSFLVLNEIDLMLIMYSEMLIKELLKYMRSDKQIILTRTTWPIKTPELVKYIVDNPVQIKISFTNSLTIDTIIHKFICIRHKEKQTWLEKFLKQKKSKNDKVLVFMRNRSHVETLHSNLKNKGIKCSYTHGGKTQIHQKDTVADMHSGVVSILIATNIATVGIDFNDIDLVIYYCLPLKTKDYIHRIHKIIRTSPAITLFSLKDKLNIQKFIKVTERFKNKFPKELFNVTMSSCKQAPLINNL